MLLLRFAPLFGFFDFVVQLAFEGGAFLGLLVHFLLTPEHNLLLLFLEEALVFAHLLRIELLAQLVRLLELLQLHKALENGLLLQKRGTWFKAECFLDMGLLFHSKLVKLLHVPLV